MDIFDSISIRSRQTPSLTRIDHKGQTHHTTRLTQSTQTKTKQHGYLSNMHKHTRMLTHIRLKQKNMVYVSSV